MCGLAIAALRRQRDGGKPPVSRRNEPASDKDASAPCPDEHAHTLSPFSASSHTAKPTLCPRLVIMHAAALCLQPCSARHIRGPPAVSADDAPVGLHVALWFLSMQAQATLMPRTREELACVAQSQDGRLLSACFSLVTCHDDVLDPQFCCIYSYCGDSVTPISSEARMPFTAPIGRCRGCNLREGIDGSYEGLHI